MTRIRSAWHLRCASNSGRARILGLEAQGRWSPWAWLDLELTYTRVDARSLAHGGARLAGRSPHLVHARVHARAPRWVAGWVRARWQAAFPLDRFDTLVEEGRTWLDAGLELGPWQRLRLHLVATNLLDKRDAVDSIQFPLPGRAFAASLAYSTR